MHRGLLSSGARGPHTAKPRGTRPGASTFGRLSARRDTLRRRRGHMGALHVAEPSRRRAGAPLNSPAAVRFCAGGRSRSTAGPAGSRRLWGRTAVRSARAPGPPRVPAPVRRVDRPPTRPRPPARARLSPRASVPSRAWKSPSPRQSAPARTGLRRGPALRPGAPPVRGSAAVRPGTAAQGWILLGRDRDHGLQQPQLERGGLFGHHPGGLGQLLGGLQLRVRVDDACAALTVGLRLPGHRTLHRVGQDTSLISTRSICTPQPMAGLSIISSSPWLSFSRLESRSSRSLLPMIERSEVCAICETANR